MLQQRHAWYGNSGMQCHDVGGGLAGARMRDLDAFRSQQETDHAI
jgi:hypothetical protein